MIETAIQTHYEPATDKQVVVVIIKVDATAQAEEFARGKMIVHRIQELIHEENNR